MVFTIVEYDITLYIGIFGLDATYDKGEIIFINTQCVIKITCRATAV